MQLSGDGGSGARGKDGFLSWAIGVWELDGERYELSITEDGVLVARMLNGVEVSAAWVISRGRKVPPQPAPARSA